MKWFNMVLLLVLVSCVSSEDVVRTTVSRTQTALPTITTKLTVTPSGTSKPSQTPTKLPTLTPTVTPTFTPIPASSILLQEDFEDNKANGWFSWNKTWTKGQGPNWTIVQESDGNHYASASGPNAPICYGDKSLAWTDYAFESRIQFVVGTALDVTVHSNCGKAQYSVDIHESGTIVFAYWNEQIGYTDLGTVTLQPLVRNRWYTIRVEIAGDVLNVYINNSLVGIQKLPTPLLTKQGGISYDVRGEKFYFDDIKVWSLK